MSTTNADDGELLPPDEPESVGMAEMDDDGTLRMHLSTRTAEGMVGEMLMVVPPDDARHAGYVAHLGGIRPGEARPIPPFPPPAIDPDSV